MDEKLPEQLAQSWRLLPAFGGLQTMVECQKVYVSA